MWMGWEDILIFLHVIITLFFLFLHLFFLLLGLALLAASALRAYVSIILRARICRVSDAIFTVTCRAPTPEGDLELNFGIGIFLVAEGWLDNTSACTFGDSRHRIIASSHRRIIHGFEQGGGR